MRTHVSLGVLYAESSSYFRIPLSRESSSNMSGRQTESTVFVIAMRREYLSVNSDLFVDCLAKTTSHPENQQRNICSFRAAIEHMNSYAMLQTAADNNALLQCCCACPAP
jgi:hypothetical protein